MDSALRISKIGKYQLGQALGSGAAGAVYLATDPFVGRTVAIKLIAASDDDADMLTSETAFLTEARATGALQHPNVATLYDAGVETGYYYLVMEYVAGPSLADLRRSLGGRVPAERVQRLALGCAAALRCAHGHGVFHRDIKPSNIVVGADDEPKLVDFGVAALAENNRTRHDYVTGTPAYMAPEQLRGARATAVSDLYSLGVVLYELLAQRRPFDHLGRMQQLAAIGRERPPGVATVEPTVPPALAAIVDRMIEPDPRARFQSAAEVVQALSDLDHAAAPARSAAQMSDDERRLLRNQLKRQRLLAGMDEPQHAEILGAAEFASYTPGEDVMKEGSEVRALHIVVSGGVAVHKGRRLIARIDSGECFGEIGFASDGRQPVAITADRWTLVMTLQRTAIERLSVATRLALMESLCRTLSYRLRVATARLAAEG